MSTLVLVAGLIAVFIAIVLVIVASGAAESQRREVGRSLAAVQAMQASPSSMRPTIDQPFKERVITPAMARLTRSGRTLTGKEQSSSIRRKLDLAGNPKGWDVDRVIAFKMLGALVGLVAGLLLGVVIGNILIGLGLVIMLVLLGFFAPNLALYQTAYNRTERMRRELPDALDLMTISVEAGLSFDAALAQVSRNTTGPLAEEFFRVLQEMQIGTGRADAIRGMGERTDLAELRGFTTAMIQADSFGIPIANVLRVQARELRIKRSQRAEEMAQKVPVKILFPLIFCILPLLFIAILGPAGIQIAQNFGGR
jgi:tight adherence protein C